MQQNDTVFEQRLARVLAAEALQVPDRVPIAPKIGNFYARGYGIQMYDVMQDMRNLKPGVEGFLTDYAPDMVVGVSVYPIGILEELGVTFIRWPGATHQMGLDESYQILDGTFLEDDEYDEFIQDPTHFMMAKLLPRKCKKLKGLSKLYLRNPVEFSLFSDMSLWADPEVKEAIGHITRAGDMWRTWAKQCSEAFSCVNQMGFPMRTSHAQTSPFDMFADNIRGLIATVMDVKEEPERLADVLEFMTKVCIERTVSACKEKKCEYVVIPMHAGVDEFMSPRDYERFYWPGLKALMEAVIKIGVTPVAFCQGNYNTRLECLCDVPKGKVIYQFEKADMKRVKETVGKVACICGNLPTSLLAFGTAQEVSDACKVLIDTAAPGGGFIMDCSITMDNVRHENLRAMFETTLAYGNY